MMPLDFMLGKRLIFVATSYTCMFLSNKFININCKVYVALDFCGIRKMLKFIMKM